MDSTPTMANRSIGKLMLQGDHFHLNQRLGLLPTHKRASAKAHYKKVFLEGVDQEPIKHKKANAGRRAANLWILDYVG